MNNTNEIYDFVIRSLAGIRRAQQLPGLPANKIFSESFKKSEIDNTPLPPLHDVHDEAARIQSIQTLGQAVEIDINKVKISPNPLSEPVLGLLMRCAKYEILWRRLATSALRDNLEQEQQKLLNIARMLKLALQPELVPFSCGTAGARIDRMNITPEQLKAGQWDVISETAYRSLGPSSMDEYVIVKASSGPDSLTTQSGVAFLCFGKNKYGVSDNPEFGIYNFSTYKRTIEFFPDYEAARRNFLELTQPEDANTNALHTRVGNFIGGAFSDDTYHPHPAVGRPGIVQDPWILGLKEPTRTRIERVMLSGWQARLRKALALIT
jgi:hypothetical protein